MEAGLGMVDIVQVMFAYRLLLRMHVRSDQTYRGKWFFDFSEILQESYHPQKKKKKKNEPSSIQH